MAAIYPIPTTRSSESLVQTRLLSQLQTDQLDLLRLQTQISTGRRVLAGSEDAPAAIRAIGLQRLLEQKAQVQTNLNTNQSYLSASEVAMSSLAGLIIGIRGTAVAVADTTASTSERRAAAVEIDRALQQIMNVANQQFRGRYLFAGSETTARPYDASAEFIRYNGNESLLQSYADIDLLFESNIPGNLLFGGLSAERKGTADLNPVLTADTRLSALRGGLGISKGSISISDGSSTRVIDISSAETIGDVAGLIERHPPAGRRIIARVTSSGLEIDIDDAGGGNLTIREVGGGTTAAQLGIFNQVGVGAGTLIGKDLNPRLGLTTRLDNILGTRATAVLRSPSLNNDIYFEAQERGAAYNDIAIQLIDDELLAAGAGLSAGAEVATFHETAGSAVASVTWGDGPAGENDIVIAAMQAGTQFNNVRVVLAKQAGIGAGTPSAVYVDDGTTRTLTVTFDDAVDTSIGAIKGAINGIQIGGQQAFTATDDNSANGGDGTGSVSFNSNAGEVGNSGNSGVAANTISVRIRSGATTANHVVEALHANPDVTARFAIRIDEKDTSSPSIAGTGVVAVSAAATSAGGAGQVFDQTSGMQIINGGQTHTVTFNDAETVEDLLNILNGSAADVIAEINAAGTGINVRSRLSGADFRIGENGGQTATQLGLRTFTEETRLNELNYGLGVHQGDGTDFTIRRNDGVELAIDLATATTIGDVLNLINNHPDNLNSATRVTARLAISGNGIELVDDNPTGIDQLTVTRAFNSEAAWDLGLIPRGQDSVKASDGAPPAAATATIRLAEPSDANTGFVLTAAQVGTAFNGVQVVFQNVAATGNQALVDYDADTKILTIDVDPAATTANTVINAIQAEGTFGAALETTLDPTNNGGGLMTATGLVGVAAGGSSNPASLPATAAVPFPMPNHLHTALSFTAVHPGTLYNDVEIEFVNDQVGDLAVVNFNPVSKRLQIHIDATLTTANTVRTAVNDAGDFLVELDRTTDTANDGSGILGAAGVVATTSGGTPEVLSGSDTFTIEASGVFNSLMRLQRALESDDQVAIARAAGLLEEDLERVSFARADVGAKSQSLDTLRFRLEDETVELKTTLSTEIDIDLVEAISNLTARQASYQASLQLMGKTFQLSLLDFV